MFAMLQENSNDPTPIGIPVYPMIQRPSGPLQVRDGHGLKCPCILQGLVRLGSHL